LLHKTYPMSTPFFTPNHYFIDEKVDFFKFENRYLLYDGDGQRIGGIYQKLTAGQKLLRLLLNKGMLPFMLEIQDEAGVVQATVKRGWTFWMSSIEILDHQGQAIGKIKQQFRLLKSRFRIYDAQEQLVAEINGDWTAWDFVISDAQGQAIGAISKKWAGLAKEMFTTADKYNVGINPALTNPQQKVVILAAAITIDMVLKESK